MLAQTLERVANIAEDHADGRWMESVKDLTCQPQLLLLAPCCWERSSPQLQSNHGSVALAHGRHLVTRIVWAGSARPDVAAVQP